MSDIFNAIFSFRVQPNRKHVVVSVARYETACNSPDKYSSGMDEMLPQWFRLIKRIPPFSWYLQAEDRRAWSQSGQVEQVMMDGWHHRLFVRGDGFVLSNHRVMKPAENGIMPVAPSKVRRIIGTDGYLYLVSTEIVE